MPLILWIFTCESESANWRSVSGIVWRLRVGRVMAKTVRLSPKMVE